MSDYRDQVKAAVDATAFHSATRFTWFGHASPRLSRNVAAVLSEAASERYLLAMLQSTLYTNWYRPGSARPEREWDDSDVVDARASPFLDRLRAANVGRGYWSHGWTVLKNTDADLVVEKSGLRVLVSMDDCRQSNGRHAEVRLAKELLGASPGYYMALGDCELTEGDSNDLVRLYFNLRPSGAPQMVRAATTVLNAAGVPFTAKVVADPQQYDRCDSAVLYVQKAAYREVRKELREIYHDCEGHLRQATPSLTKRLANGIGLAEDPGDGDSFGMHRCRRLAEAMMRTARQGDASQRFSAVEKQLLTEGIDLDAPYLNAGSSDAYAAWSRGLPMEARKVSHVSMTKSRTDAALDVAAGIGAKLLADAVWSGDACTWLGHTYDATQPRGAARTLSVEYRALEGDLYSGTAGVALFLADLAHATGNRAVRSAALGALRHAFLHCREVDPSVRLGLFTGWPGIALAGARVAAVVEAEEFLHRADRLMHDLMDERGRAVKTWDLLSGAAGAISASISLADALSQPSLVDFASELGESLLSGADVRAEGISWKSADVPRGPNLTGFAHGTAGIAYALTELYRCTGDERFKIGAQSAMNYETHWFDDDARNWPDFRGVSRRSLRSGSRGTCSMFWCHGAPGIALSRLHAYEVLRAPDYKAEAITALTTTSEAIKAWLRSEDGSFCLCHGLAGNAEIVAHGSEVLQAAWPAGQSLARRVAEEGIDRYVRTGREWPCGTVGETPNLMLGLAGVGHFYLRVHDAEYASLIARPGF